MDDNGFLYNIFMYILLTGKGRELADMMQRKDVQRGYAGSWCDRRCTGQGKMEDDFLWGLLEKLGKTERGTRYNLSFPTIP